MQKIYAEFCRLRDLRDAGAEAPKYTEAQAFAISIPPCAAETAPCGSECCGQVRPVAAHIADRNKP